MNEIYVIFVVSISILFEVLYFGIIIFLNIKQRLQKRKKS